MRTKQKATCDLKFTKMRHIRGCVKKRHICCYLKTLSHRCSTNSLGVRLSFHLKYFHTRAALKKTEALNAEISEMEKRAKDAGLWNTSLGSKMKDLEEESAAVWAQIETGHRKHRELLKELEVRKEEKVELLGNRYAVMRVQRKKIPCIVIIERSLKCLDLNFVTCH